MGYKMKNQNLGFDEFALASSMKHIRTFKNMKKLDKTIEWQLIGTT